MSCVRYIGVDDTDIDLFESQYIVPDGMCYNSYLIEDEKVAVMDTVDVRKFSEWMRNLKSALDGRTPDYLVVQHMEPDHSGSLACFLEAFPDVTVVASDKALLFINQFFEGLSFKCLKIAEGDSLVLGRNTLQFFSAPMVHWPEVMVSYLPSEKTLFSADGFGKFGVYDADPDDWACEARRYYFNICGKYGAQVSALLKKAASLEIEKVCPLHGPVLEGGRLAEAIRLYSIWSSYAAETPGGVLVAYASIHGGTKAVAEKLADVLRAKGAEKVAVTDLCRDDVAEAVEDAFRMGTMVLACATYDGNIFPPMHNFIHKLSLKGFQKRRVGLIENGTWAPQAARIMRGMLEGMKEIEILNPTVTIKSRMKEADADQLDALAQAVLNV